MFGPFALFGVICLMTPLQHAHASDGGAGAGSSKNASTGITAQRAQIDYKIDKGVSADFRAYFVTGKEESKLSFAEKAKRNITRYQANLNVSF